METTQQKDLYVIGPKYAILKKTHLTENDLLTNTEGEGLSVGIIDSGIDKKWAATSNIKLDKT